MWVLVTGASGFVGKALVAELRDRGHRVLAVYGPNAPIPPMTDGKTEYARADIGIRDSLREIANKRPVNAVIHAAGVAHRFSKTEDSEYTRVNVEGVRNVAETAAELTARRLVLISSVLVYGRSNRVAGRMVREDAPCNPVDSYARSKLEGEITAAETCGRNGVSLSILRPAPIIGEGSKGNFSRLIAALERGRFVWVGRGRNLKSLVYVGDVARVAAHLIECSDKHYEVFNVAAEPVEMREIVGNIAHRLGKEFPRVTIPASPVRNLLSLARRTPFKDAAGRFSSTLETWLAEDIYSSARLQREYSVGPMSSVKDAINREVKYYLSNK